MLYMHEFLKLTVKILGIQRAEMENLLEFYLKHPLVPRLKFPLMCH